MNNSLKIHFLFIFKLLIILVVWTKSIKNKFDNRSLASARQNEFKMNLKWI